MIAYKTIILKFARQGEKTGWTYIEVPADVAEQIKPGNKKGFRVKGQLDSFSISGIALLPMGRGNFIMPLNAAIRKGIGKRQGAMLQVKLEEDKTEYELNADLLECLSDDPSALVFFNTLPGSHRRYFSKWIESAKTEETYARRIAMAVNALAKKQGYPEMLRAAKALKR